jgi:competence protein ComEC
VAQGLSVIIMDAGQGDATLIVYPDNSLVLVDCGCKKNGEAVKGEIEKVLGKYLALKGNMLKALILTHSDGDHYNLVNELIVEKEVTVEMLIFSGKPAEYTGISDWIQGKRGPQIINQHAMGQDYYAYTPLSDLSSKSSVNGYIIAANVASTKKRNDSNPKSVTIMLTYKTYSIFLMGDATEDTENFILETDETSGELTKLLQAFPNVVLKAGHHGSLTSSSEDWLKKLQPQVVFISSDTKSFRGTSLPRSTIIGRVLAGGSLVNVFAKSEEGKHHYVQYNDKTDKHEAVETELALFTTLYQLKFAKNGTDFTAYGTSWYYEIEPDGSVFMTPACKWKNINKTY